MNTITSPLKYVLGGSLNKALLGTFVALFVMYSALIASTVVSINARKDLYQDIRAKQAALSELEIQYFKVAHAIDMDTAHSMGFADTQSVAFAYTDPGAQDAVAVR